jgi:tetratricopeptide (TPR) repeat protein
MSLVKYSEYDSVKSDSQLQEEIDCFFKKSIQFKPSDYRVYQIYGIYLFGKGDYRSSIENYQKALSIRSSAEVHYNIGLSYLKLGDFINAEIHARKAYDKGYPLPGLKNMLLENEVSIE